MHDPSRFEAITGRELGTATTEGTWNTACIMSTAEREARTLRDIGHNLSLSCHLRDELTLA